MWAEARAARAAALRMENFMAKLVILVLIEAL